MLPESTHPPVDGDAVASRLSRALAGDLVVRVRRWISGADRVDGLVVAVGVEWVAVQQLSAGFAFDGWQLIRVRDIQAVSVDPDPECFVVRALKARGTWPPTAPGLDLDDVHGAVATASALSTVCTIHDEFADPDSCLIGRVVSVDETSLRLLEIDPRAEWARTVTVVDLGNITRIDIGGGYEHALELVAGRPPSVPFD